MKGSSVQDRDRFSASVALYYFVQMPMMGDDMADRVITY